MKEVLLYFGSFNPVHHAHLIVAVESLKQTELDELWFVLSPQSPDKKKSSLASNIDRKTMIDLSISSLNKIRSCAIEFELPQPSYTIQTVDALKLKYPNYRFSILMGSDNLKGFYSWKSSEELHAFFTHIYVYPRPGSVIPPEKKDKKVVILDTPQVQISSTQIRNYIKNNKEYSHLLPKSVAEYIKAQALYQNN